LAFYAVAKRSVVYVDRGISRGMRAGIREAERHGVPVEYRSIEPGPATAARIRALIDREALHIWGIDAVSAFDVIDAAARRGVSMGAELSRLRDLLHDAAMGLSRRGDGTG
jgi:hypothetical protein